MLTVYRTLGSPTPVDDHHLKIIIRELINRELILKDMEFFITYQPIALGSLIEF